MNRRDALTTSVGLIASVAGFSQTAESGSALGANVNVNEKPEAEGELCPIYPAYFHGTYTTYFGGIQTSGTCGQYRSYDGPNGLQCGCASGGCGPAKEDQATKSKGIRKDNHDALKKNGMKEVPDENFRPVKAPGAAIVASKIIWVKGKHPKPNKPDITYRAQILDGELTPKSFDLLPDLGTLDPFPNPPVPVAFGFEIQQGSAIPTDVKQAKNEKEHLHVVNVNGKDYRIALGHRD